MSLLLDARKKAQQALSGKGAGSNHSGIELSLEEFPVRTTATSDLPPSAATFGAPSPDNSARSAGKNLFNAKSPATPVARMGGINRNLLFALGGTVTLLISGAGYLWYIDSASNIQPIRPRPSVAPVVTQNTISAGGTTAPTSADGTQSGKRSRDTYLPKQNAPRKKRRSAQEPDERIQIEPQQIERPDILIDNAYLAYRSGKLGEAKQMYLEVLGKDARNTDALLGLAAIAQQRGEDVAAAQYYMRALSLDPRNDVANAGMSALRMEENSESRLKYLLREQRDSAALHFALGNIYSGQSRWGEAQSAYFNAYTLDPKNAELAFNLAVSLDHLGQSKMAAQYYQRALQLDLAGGRQYQGIDHAKISQRVKDLTR